MQLYYFFYDLTHDCGMNGSVKLKEKIYTRVYMCVCVCVRVRMCIY